MRPLATLRSVMQFRAIDLDPVSRRLRTAADVTDLRRIAKRRLPWGVFDYIDGAAEDEKTMARNSAGFRAIGFRPRVLKDVSDLDTSTTLLGRKIAMPLVVAPAGFVRIADPAGELAVARAAARAGVPFSLSTLATRSIEEVAAVSDGDLWFQVYVWKDRGLVKELLDRARDAGYSTIAVTVDTAVLGRRERDIRRGFTLPPKLGPSILIDGILHPGWTWAFIRAEPIVFSNVVGKGVGDGVDAVSLSHYTDAQFDPSLSWRDLDWFRANWAGSVVIKGVQTVEDARASVDAGVDAIALSNHGGRQLEGAPSPIDLLEPVVAAVGGDVQIIVDGGPRRGSDIVRAVALGANAVMTARPFLYGLGAAGERGVDHVFELFRSGMERTMALVGARTVADLGPELTIRRGS